MQRRVRPSRRDGCQICISYSAEGKVENKGAEKGGDRLSEAQGTERVGPGMTESPVVRTGPEKGGDAVRVDGTLVKLRELSVLIRRLSPEEIMLHTRKSSRKRKADCLKTSKNNCQSKLQKKFRRIWVVSDNSDEECDGGHGTSKTSNGSSVLSDNTCNNEESTQSPRRSTEVRQPVSKECKDCKSCHEGGNTVSVTACSKHHVKKPTVNPSEKSQNLFEPDRISLASRKSGECVLGSKTKSIRSDPERLKGASGDSNNKVTVKALLEKCHGARSPSNVKPDNGSVNSKIGVKSNGPTVANSINWQHRHSSSSVNSKSNKIHPKNDGDHKSSIHVKGANPKKSLNMPQRESVSGTNQIHDLKSTKSDDTSVSPHGGSIQGNCRTPVRAVENTPPLPEKGESKVISKNNQSSVSKESHLLKSSEKPLRELITSTTADHGMKGKIVRKNLKTKEGYLIDSNKHKHCASPIRLAKNSQVLSERLCPKEKVTGVSDIVSKKIHSVISKEKTQIESVSILGKELDLKVKLIGKSGDGHLIASDKHKQCASPVPQSLPVLSERLGQKEIVTGNDSVLLKETHTDSSKEKSHSEPVPVPVKELDLKGKCQGKNIKNKDAHLLACDKNKKSTIPVRPAIVQSMPSEICGPKDMGTSKNDIVHANPSNANPSNANPSNANPSHANPSKEKPQISQDHRVKGSSNEKTVLSKDGIGAYKVSTKLTCAGRAGENVAMLPGPKEMLASDHVSKETIPTSSKEKLPNDSVSSTNVSSADMDLNGKCVGNSIEARDSGCVGEASKHCSPSVRVVEIGPLSTEKVGSEVSSSPPKSTDRSHKELISVINQERKLKKGHVSQNMKSKDHHFGCERSKQLVSPVQFTDDSPLSHESPGPKETLAGNHDHVSIDTWSMKSTEKPQRNLASLTVSEADLRKKIVLQNARSKDDHSATEKVKLISSPTGAVDIGPFSSEKTGLSDKMVISNDAVLKEINIHPKDELKHSHPSVNKSRPVSKISVAPTVSSSPQGKPPLEVVSSKPHQVSKEVCRRDKDKLKSAIVPGEKSQQSSKVDNGSRRLSREIRLSAERDAPIGTLDPVLEGRFAGPVIKSNEIDLNKKSQQNPKLSNESVKTCESKGKEVEFLRSSLIEKSGGSCVVRDRSSSAIEADNIDQLMAEYETLTSHDSSKTSGEKKTDRKLNKRKILNIFGEEHLMEDSESMMMSPVQTIPASISAIGLLESSSSILDDDPSLQVAEISGSIAIASLNTDIIKRKNTDEGKEVIEKKRKLSGAGSRKRDGKSRRHSLEVSSVKSTPEKKPVLRGRTSLDCTDSRNENRRRDSSSCHKSQETRSPVRDSEARHSFISRASVISPSGGQYDGEGQQRSGQSKTGNCNAEKWAGKVRKRDADLESAKDRPSLPSLLSETSSQGEEAAGGEYTIDEDPDITVLDINCLVKEENPWNREEIIYALNPECTSSDQLGQILVSSPRSLAVEDGPPVDSSQDCLGNGVEEPSVVHQSRADSVPDLEEQGVNDDLTCPDGKLWDEFVIEQKLRQVEQEFRRKEEEMQLAKAKKEKVLRAWEMICGIEFLEIEVQKKEHGVENDRSSTPLFEKSQEVNIVDLKEEFDIASTVSTEILESTDDFQDLQQQGDCVSEAGNTRDTDLGGNSVTPVDNCVHLQENMETRTSACDEGSAVVSGSEVEKSAAVPINRGSKVQLGAKKNLADSGSDHLLGEQEAQRPAIEISGATESTVREGQSCVSSGGNGSGGREPRKEDRIRVRGLSDLLAVPSTQQSDSQDNHVATYTETNNPDKDIRDSFKGEKAYISFKNLLEILSKLFVPYINYLESRGTPNFKFYARKLVELYQINSPFICRLCSDVIFNFRYNDPQCFASFLYFQVSFIMQRNGDHRESFSHEQLKGLLTSIFRFVVKNWNPESKEGMAKYLASMLQKMGMSGIGNNQNTNTPANSQMSPILSNSSNVVLSQTSVQSVTLNNVVLHNPSAQTNATGCQVLSVPLVASHQNLPGNVISIRNQQVPSHLVNTNSGIQTGHIQGRLGVSSTSDSGMISGQPEVNCAPAAFHVDSACGLSTVPNVCVNPNQKQRSNIPFVPVHSLPTGTLTNVTRLVGGELLHANQNRVIGGQLSHNSAGGQLNPNCGSLVAGQNSNSVQNLITFTQAFHNVTNQVANNQLANPVHSPASASNVLRTQLSNHMHVPFVAQQTSATSNHQNNNTVSAQTLMPGSNRVQHRRLSHSGQVIHNQDSMQSQSLQGDLPSYYQIPGSTVVSSVHSVNVQRPLVQATPLHSSQSVYQSHPSSMNTDYRPPPPYNQGRPHVISQGQLQRSDNVVPTTAQSNHCPPLSYFSSASHSGGITGTHSVVRQALDRVTLMPVVQNAGQATTMLHSGTEGIARKRQSAEDVLRWRQQQVPQTQSYINTPTNQAVVNHSVVLPNSASHVPNHPIYSQDVQHGQQGHSVEVRPSIIQNSSRRSVECPTEHTSSVLNTAPQPVNSMGVPLQSTLSYTAQQHSGRSMGMRQYVSGANPGTFAEQVVTASRHHTMLPSIASPVHRSSPGSISEENDQAGAEIQNNGDLETRSRGQGLCRPISNDSGYRSPSQGCENSGNNSSFAGVCYSCHQEALLTCSRCQLIFYCSVGCQTKDWGRHKHDCRVQVPGDCK